jgi:ATP-dependent DNA helicase RecG
MRLAGTVRGVGRQDVHEYPVEALREAIVNAIMHRDHSPPSRGAQVQVEMYPLFTGQQDLTASDIAQATGLSKAMTNRHLARLVSEGRLIATAPPASRNRAYRLPPNAP